MTDTLRTDIIRLVDDPVLRTPTEPVTDFGPDLTQLVARMNRVMTLAEGVGLAANQIGVSLRVFVYDLGDGRSGHVVNPTLLVDPAADIVNDQEGCLSLPGQHHLTPRADLATVSGVDVEGRPIEVSGDGWMARCLQHEVDHLDGVVYLDRLDPKTRRAALDVFYSPGDDPRPRSRL